MSSCSSWRRPGPDWRVVTAAIAAYPLQRLAELSGAELVRFALGEPQVRDQRALGVEVAAGPSR